MYVTGTAPRPVHADSCQSQSTQWSSCVPATHSITALRAAHLPQLASSVLLQLSICLVELCQLCGRLVIACFFVFFRVLLLSCFPPFSICSVPCARLKSPSVFELTLNVVHLRSNYMTATQVLVIFNPVLKNRVKCHLSLQSDLISSGVDLS